MTECRRHPLIRALEEVCQKVIRVVWALGAEEAAARAEALATSIFYKRL